MRLNENTKIIGSNVMLVPYKEKHVPKTGLQFNKEGRISELARYITKCRYHTWMSSEELRHLTASEQLSLEEEYSNQKSWHIDENKCTFIILDKGIHSKSKNEIDSMIGDTNFFFTRPDGKLCAEAEIMIAEDSSRGKKRGWEAMLQMLLYGVVFIQIEQFVVKIGDSNTPSINMFQKMGFAQTKPVDIFNEITMEKNVDSDWIDWIRSQLPIHEILNYDIQV